MKINVSLNDDLLKRVDEYAKANYMSRSGFLAICASQYLNAAELTASINTMAFCFRQIAETGNISDEQMKQLKDFEVLSRILSENSKNVL